MVTRAERQSWKSTDIGAGKHERDFKVREKFFHEYGD
jgi:hypothetical protein